MRRAPAPPPALSAALAALTLAATALTALAAVPPAVSPAAAAEGYTWKNVQIGGGGFVPGIVFSRKERNLVYARTDIGGAYRWDQATRSWTPLLDWVGRDRWGHNGVISMAADPVDADRVYAAVGMYTNDWDPGRGAVLRSADRGRTWQTAALPFKLGGNMPGRGMGERLAVDPHDNRVLYLGAPEGNGLWRSTDRGATWSRVTGLTAVGDHADDPSDTNGYGSHRPGVVWVTFDEGTGTAGSPTRTIYVGVADKKNTVYRSTDAGTTWEPVPGAPTGHIAHKGVLDAASHTLYIATSDTAGPYDGSKGDVWRLDTRSGAWTRISPVPSDSADAHFGYSGLTVDRNRPGTLMVATQMSWWPDVVFFRSTDSGKTWTRAWDYSGYPNRSLRYRMDVTATPWLTFGATPAPPETAPKLGWMTESVEIDPFDSDRLMYGTGATLYGTEDLTAWDRGGRFTVRPMVEGLEETAVQDLVSPPSGAPLVSALLDLGGFRHTALDRVPEMMFTRPNFTSGTSLDYAEAKPEVMVRAGDFTDADRPADSHVAFSTDGGATWTQGPEPSGVNRGGTVAAGADGANFVWAPGDAGQPVVHATGPDSGWTRATGVPANAVVESDRVNPRRFYALAEGRLHVSADGGRSFTAAATGLPTGRARFKAVPGAEGEIWVAGDSGLYRSTDSGATFTKLPGVTGAVNVGFGKAAPGRTRPAVYLVATVNGQDGLFRSDDTGATWVRVNDDRHQYGNMGDALTGDPRVYGRVYLGTNGRGIVYGDLGGGGPTDPPPTTGCKAVYRQTGSWSGGHQGEVTVTNTGASPAKGWKVTWTFPAGRTVSASWNARVTQQGTAVTAVHESWNGSLAAGGATSFGFTATGAPAEIAPSCTAG
ncbi:cellulose binding domain-containing protein [Actinomadura kijaniata]|uniref:cellulose binding domain-containing protein n=1 Tax=Actinomadura kijaniata TaxID=46161 RepID=UPI000AEA177A|nr:cellulose binding domain-containing protein [Actinomadura kijaniata]